VLTCPLPKTSNLTPPELISIDELQLLRKIEEHIDIEDAKKALEKPGENLSAEDFWKQLGIL